MYIREGIEKECVDSQDLVFDLQIDIIVPEEYHTYSETIMDVQPIACKEGGDEIGSGTTRVLDGVIMMVTGTDANGVQIGEFGSSEGYLDENIMWNRPGAPDKGEIFIKTQVTIKEGMNMERPGPLAAHTATDVITQEIRDALKELDDDSLVVHTETFDQVRRPGRKKVVIVKEIMGQGAMHDNLILPVEPVGVLGAKPNVDLGNVPVCVSPLEVLDGCIHALDLHRAGIQRDVQALLEGAAGTRSAPRSGNRPVRCNICGKPADQFREILCFETCRYDGGDDGCGRSIYHNRRLWQ